MKQVAQQMPTAHIAVNKGRLKVYNKKSDIPTYYLKKGQEFQIELFNPTTDTLLAKISLNNKAIAQGGLVLRPGERVFLERYIDVQSKFKFDTYEVSNTNAVKQAIAENGDFTVEFFKEDTRPAYVPYYDNYYGGYNYNNPTFGGVLRGGTTTGGYAPHTLTSADQVYGNLNLTNIGSGQNFDVANASLDVSSKIGELHDGAATLDWMDVERDRSIAQPETLERRSIKKMKSKRSKTIETGRVEQGSHSDQKLTMVSKKFHPLSFHKIEYKMLPVSQKVNTTQDISVKRYCTECGAKQKPNFKFCPSCGAKA